MKRFIYLAILLCFPLMTWAQDKKFDADRHKERIEQFKLMKRNFIVEQTGMTDNEAKAFFPLYDELQDKKFSLNHGVRNRSRTIMKSKEGLSDKQYLEVADAYNDLHTREVKLQNEYYQKFKKILPPKKLFLLQRAEVSFGKQMLKDRSKQR